jgi:hypothetical protein
MFDCISKPRRFDFVLKKKNKFASTVAVKSEIKSISIPSSETRRKGNRELICYALSKLDKHYKNSTHLSSFQEYMFLQSPVQFYFPEKLWQIPFVSVCDRRLVVSTSAGAYDLSGNRIVAKVLSITKLNPQPKLKVNHSVLNNTVWVATPH